MPTKYNLTEPTSRETILKIIGRAINYDLKGVDTLKRTLKDAPPGYVGALQLVPGTNQELVGHDVVYYQQLDLTALQPMVNQMATVQWLSTKDAQGNLLPISKNPEGLFRYTAFQYDPLEFVDAYPIPDATSPGLFLLTLAATPNSLFYKGSLTFKVIVGGDLRSVFDGQPEVVFATDLVTAVFPSK